MARSGPPLRLCGPLFRCATSEAGDRPDDVPFVTARPCHATTRALPVDAELSGMEWRPLGEYEAFADWSGHPRSWGPDRRWQVWFAGGVIDGLVQVLHDHIASVQRRSRFPAVIGCSPWLTSDAVVDCLLKTACCVVMAKNAVQAPTRLAQADCGFPNVLPGLRHRYPKDADGGPLGIDPYVPKWEHQLGPVRVTGGRGPTARKRLAHAKLLLLGELFWADDNTDYGTYIEETFFEATSLWWGSANLTGPSANHLEVGFWCDDPELLRWAEGFMDDLLAFSEPADSQCAGPEPNLLPVEWDDAAMRAYAAETRAAAFETEAEMRAGGAARQPIASA